MTWSRMKENAFRFSQKTTSQSRAECWTLLNISSSIFSFFDVFVALFVLFMAYNWVFSKVACVLGIRYAICTAHLRAFHENMEQRRISVRISSALLAGSHNENWEMYSQTRHPISGSSKWNTLCWLVCCVWCKTCSYVDCGINPPTRQVNPMDHLRLHWNCTNFANGSTVIHFVAKFKISSPKHSMDLPNTFQHCDAPLVELLPMTRTTFEKILCQSVIRQRPMARLDAELIKAFPSQAKG